MPMWTLVFVVALAIVTGAALVVATRGRDDPRAASEAALLPQVERARERGWEVVEYPDAAWPPLLEADRTEPVRCDLAIRADEADVQAWTVRVNNLLSSTGLPVRVHLVRVPAPGLPELLLRREPLPFEYVPGSNRTEVSVAVPWLFRGRALEDAPSGFLLAGDLDDALRERLAPLLGQVDASGCYVVAGDGHLTVMGHGDIDGDELERRIGLARRLVDALAQPSG